MILRLIFKPARRLMRRAKSTIAEQRICDVSKPESTLMDRRPWPVFGETSHSRLCDHFCWHFDAMRKKVEPNPDKSPIILFMGDPNTIAGAPRCDYVAEALIRAVKSRKYDGYPDWGGNLEARQAIAYHYSNQTTSYTADDVIVTIGGDHAFELMISGLADQGENILIPRPCYAVYKTLADIYQFELHSYGLNPQHGLIDLEDLQRQITSKTKAILINNPHNPLGVVYPRHHLEEVLRLAESYQLPVLSDEIYSEIVFGKERFHRLTDLEPKVPILTLDALSKNYLVPGWRCGWLLLRDHQDSLSQVWKGMKKMSYKTVGVTSVIQGALPDILKNTPKAYFDDLNELLKRNADLFYNLLKNIKGLKPFKPEAAFYMCTKIDEELLGEEIDFCSGLIEEEAVIVLPTSFLGLQGHFRVILLMPEEKIIECCERIATYCERRIRNRDDRKDN